MLPVEYVPAGQVVVAVVVAVRRGPGQATVDEGLNDLVDVDGGVVLEGIVAGDKVAVEDDEVRVFAVEDSVDDLDRVDVLLWAPGVPGIWSFRQLRSAYIL